MIIFGSIIDNRPTYNLIKLDETSYCICLFCLVSGFLVLGSTADSLEHNPVIADALHGRSLNLTMNSRAAERGHEVRATPAAAARRAECALRAPCPAAAELLAPRPDTSSAI